MKFMKIIRGRVQGCTFPRFSPPHPRETIASLKPCHKVSTDTITSLEHSLVVLVSIVFCFDFNLRGLMRVRRMDLGHVKGMPNVLLGYEPTLVAHGDIA